MCVCVCVCVCVCACVCERERERESMCVCVCTNVGFAPCCRRRISSAIVRGQRLRDLFPFSHSANLFLTGSLAIARSLSLECAHSLIVAPLFCSGIHVTTKATFCQLPRTPTRRRNQRRQDSPLQKQTSIKPAALATTIRFEEGGVVLLDKLVEPILFILVVALCLFGLGNQIAHLLHQTR